jgi:hypothetical protein
MVVVWSWLLSGATEENKKTCQGRRFRDLIHRSYRMETMGAVMLSAEKC